MTEAYITRAEFERALDRVEARWIGKADQVLDAVSDLKANMNGQFSRQGEILMRHDTSIGVLNDRSGRDMGARLGAGFGAIVATIAAFLSAR